MSSLVLSRENNLIQALSDFWVNFFADSKELEILYDATLNTLGQEYLTLLHSFLGISLKDAPLTHKRYFKLITIDSNECFYSEGEDSYCLVRNFSNQQVLTRETAKIEDLEILGDRIFNPISFFNRTEDFHYFSEEDYLYFFDTNIFNVPTIPQRSLATPRQARKAFSSTYYNDATEHPSTFWIVAAPFYSAITGATTAYGVAGNNIAVKIEVTADTTALTDPLPAPILRLTTDANGVANQITIILQKYTGATTAATTIEAVQAAIRSNPTITQLIDVIIHPVQAISTTIDNPFVATGQIPTATGGFVNLEGGVDNAIQLAFWARNVEIDEFDLYNNFGYLVDRFKGSSEPYRQFLRGIFKYLIDGPTIDNLQTILNVIAGYPVVRSEGEILQEYYDPGTSIDPNVPQLGVITVRTDRNYYYLPAGTPMRTEVLLSGGETNVGYVFAGLEHLTATFDVADYISEPAWWHNKLIPDFILPNEEYSRRLASPKLIENVYGADIKVGDPGIFSGMDSTGYIPTGRAPLVHGVGYYSMNNFLKFHTFGITFPSDSTLPSGTWALIKDLKDIARQGRLADSIFFIDEVTLLSDELEISETLTAELV